MNCIPPLTTASASSSNPASSLSKGFIFKDGCLSLFSSLLEAGLERKSQLLVGDGSYPLYASKRCLAFSIICHFSNPLFLDLRNSSYSRNKPSSRNRDRLGKSGQIDVLRIILLVWKRQGGYSNPSSVLEQIPLGAVGIFLLHFVQTFKPPSTSDFFSYPSRCGASYCWGSFE